MGLIKNKTKERALSQMQYPFSATTREVKSNIALDNHQELKELNYVSQKKRMESGYLHNTSLTVAI